jgi:NADH-quinone oxidoreductase subunit L
MLFTAFLTAYYTFRLYFRVFQGPEVIPQPPADAHGHGGGHDDHGGHHNHEPLIMIAPLLVLMVGALLAGYLNFPGEKLAHFLGHSPSISSAYEVAKATYPTGVDAAAFGQEEAKAGIEAGKRVTEHGPHYWLMILSGFISLAGIYSAYVIHLKDRAKAEWLAKDFPEVVNILEHKYWVDEIYQAAVVEPLRAFGQVFFWMDKFIVDGIVWLIGFIPQLTGLVLKITTQRGYLQGYAVTMLLFITVILLYVFM